MDHGVPVDLLPDLRHRARATGAVSSLLDRHTLQYLNAIEKANCTFCTYANGVIAYVREVAARTEQFWCPIKHAQRRARAARPLPSLLRLRRWRAAITGDLLRALPAAAGADGVASAPGEPATADGHRASLTPRGLARPPRLHDREAGVEAVEHVEEHRMRR